MPSTSSPCSAKARTSYPEPQPGTNTRRPFGWVRSQAERRGGTPPASHGVTCSRYRVSQKSGLEESDATQDERDQHRYEERSEEIVAPRALGGEPLDRSAQLAEAILGKR